MKVNLDIDRKTVMSYDVLMDSGEAVVTMEPRYVEVDVEHARTHSVSYDRHDGGGRAIQRGPRAGTGRETSIDNAAPAESNDLPGASKGEGVTRAGAGNCSGGVGSGDGHTNWEGGNAGLSGIRGKGTDSVGGGSDGRDDPESEFDEGSEHTPGSDDDSKSSVEPTGESRKSGKHRGKCAEVSGNFRCRSGLQLLLGVPLRHMPALPTRALATAVSASLRMYTPHAPLSLAVIQDATPGKDTKGDGPDGTSEAARRGRSFDVKGTPRETWDAVCDTLLRELRAEGHENLRANAKKKVSVRSVSMHFHQHRARQGIGSRFTTAHFMSIKYD